MGAAPAGDPRSPAAAPGRGRGLARAQAVHALAQEAQACASPDEAARRAAQAAFEERLLGRRQPFLAVEAAPQGVLGRRIKRQLSELFVFVAYPAVPSDNNAAERRLRHLVISRTISGRTRSNQGTATKMPLASLSRTWRVQGLYPFVACRQLLASPRT